MTSNTFLRFIAILLITNSHLDHFYPLSQLGTGGAIGNALFFMLSGYGLVLSENNQPRTFLPWYKRRIARIYPSMILAVIFIIIVPQAARSNWDFVNYVQTLVWPTPYWFISALMIFYIVFFILLKRQNPKLFVIGICALAIPYLFFYLTMVDLSRYSIEGPGNFKSIFYLQTMLFGGYLASRTRFINTNIIRDGVALLLFVILYYGILLLINRGYGSHFQAVTHVLMFPITFFFLKVSFSKVITDHLMNTKYVGAFISLVAGLTLEIYMLQYNVYSHALLKDIRFPLNIVIFWIIVITLSFILNRASRFIAGRLINA